MSTLNVNRVVDASGGVLAPISSVMRNRIQNGAMVIDQRNAGASVSISTSGVYVLDRWKNRASGGGAFSVQQSSTAPAGFNTSVAYTVTTADSSIAAGDNYWVIQDIEGFNVADLGWGTASAKTVTISFWVRSSVTGTFNVSLTNGTTYDRSYVSTYTINTANTFEYKTITIAGDTTGTWGKTNGGGISLVFNLGAGTDYQATANTWVAGFEQSTSGSTNWIANAGATLFLTGVQLEVGTQATGFEYRQYGQELALCQRYYWEMSKGSLGTNGTNSWMGTGYFYSTTQFNLPIMFPVTMRSSPSLNVSNTSAFFRIDTPTGQTFSTFSIFQPSIYGTLVFVTGLTGGTAGYGCGAFTNNASAFCAFSAEL